MPTPGYPVKANRIRYEMGIRGWSMKDLARHALISQVTVNSILHGGNASPDTLDAVLMAFREHKPKPGLVELISMQEDAS